MPRPRYVLRDGSNTDDDILLVQFKLPRFLVYRVICDVLEGDGRLTQAIGCFRQLQNEATSTHDGRAQWELGKGNKPRHSRD